VLAGISTLVVAAVLTLAAYAPGANCAHPTSGSKAAPGVVIVTSVGAVIAVDLATLDVEWRRTPDGDVSR